MVQSSFYSDTPNYAEDYPTQNDGNTQPVTGNTEAPSSFYPNGGVYAALADADTTLADMAALEAAASADAAAAAVSAAAALVSETNAATSASTAAAAVQAAAGTATPLMDGVAAVGTGVKWAREDHKHPTDTSRADAAATTAALATKADDAATTAALATKADAAATTAALALKAPLASPTFTGTPAAPTASLGTNTTQLATTAFVLANASGAVGANYIINPDGAVAQETLGLTSDGSYDFDQWLNVHQNASCTASQVTAAENGTPIMMRSTQSNATAQRFGKLQWIENAFCADLRGQNVALSARVRMSVATTLRYAIVEWTGTADSITKDCVLDWTNGTFTAGNFFTSTNTVVTATGSTLLAANTLTTISLTGTVGSSMNNIAVIFWTDSTQAQNVTMDVAKVKLEIGTAATAYQRPRYDQVLAACQRYYNNTIGFAFEINVASGSDYGFSGTFPTMRTTPTLSASDSSTFNMGAPVALAALTASSFEYRKRASATGAGNLISTITANARL